MAPGVASGAQWPTHGVPDNKCPRDLHLPRPVLECGDQNRHGWCTGLLDCARYVSDRHMAHGSDGYEEHDVNVLVVDSIDPAGQLSSEATL